MNDFRDLKAIAEACQQHQPLRFMPSHGALYIRNDNGIDFDVHQNRSFPEFMAQNKDYADLVLAANPVTVLALIAEVERLHTAEGDAMTYKAGMENVAQQRDQLKAEIAGIKTGYEAFEQVNAGLKAEVEALRLALETCADELEGQVVQCYHGQQVEDMHPVTRRSYDRDMACVTEARAAMSKGEQS